MEDEMQRVLGRNLRANRQALGRPRAFAELFGPFMGGPSTASAT